MNRFLRWLFEQTKVGKYLDGKKTKIGFGFIAASVLIRAVVEILGYGVEMFPGAEFFPQTLVWASALDAQLTEGLLKVGSVVFPLGLYADKLKRDG